VEAFLYSVGRADLVRTSRSTKRDQRSVLDEERSDEARNAGDDTPSGVIINPARGEPPGSLILQHGPPSIL